MRGARPELRIVGDQDTARHLENGDGSAAEPSANFSEVDDNGPRCLSEVEQDAKWRVDTGSAVEPVSVDPAAIKGSGSDPANPAQCAGFAGSVAVVKDLNEPPADLQAEMHDEWRRVVTDLKERRLYNASMLGVVRSYVMAQWSAMQAEKSIAVHGVMVTGAGGAMKPNPATGLLRSSRDMISRLSAELGLTPTSRSRKSLQPAGPDLFSKDQWDL